MKEIYFNSKQINLFVICYSELFKKLLFLQINLIHYGCLNYLFQLIEIVQ
jgi:hypothetical protein